MCDTLRSLGGPAGLREAHDVVNETVAFVIMSAATLGLDNVKATLCAAHREPWALTLMRGGMRFNEVAVAHPEAI
jgi:hypothetical protein